MLVAATTYHHHGAVRHVIGGKHQLRHTALEAIGAGQNIDIPTVQGLDGLLALGVAQHPRLHSQASRDQAQVIGTDALVTVTIDGDIHRLVVGDGDTHA
ncbi:hypothetical protein D3C76_1536570 [compost metagenome]